MERIMNIMEDDSWFLFKKLLVKPSKTAKIMSIFFFPMTQIKSSTWVTLNMQIVSVAHRFIYATIFLPYPGAL